MKFTTKLVLRATLVAGLSMSAFAACANNVLMGDKQLKDVADGTDDKDAVNYAQVLKQTSTPVVSVNATKFSNFDESTWKPTAHKVGNMVCLHGMFRNSSGGTLDGWMQIATVPTGFYPIQYLNGAVAGYNEYDKSGRIMVTTGGAIWRSFDNVSNNQEIHIGICYISQ